MGEATPERGRPKEYFRVLPEKREALRATQHALTMMWDGVRL
jgi:hypothetical protein